MLGLKELASAWILVLGTDCRFDRPSNHPSPAFASRQAADTTASTSSTEEAWNEHLKKASIECDISMFPDDLTLSREDFLASVIHLPHQLLKQCGNDNILLFPHLNTTKFQLALSSCALQGTTVFPNSLSFAATMAGDDKDVVVWNSTRAPDGFMANATVQMDLENIHQSFFKEYEAIQASKDNNDSPSRPTDNFQPQCGVDRTEALLKIMTKIENDSKDVDRILFFLCSFYVVIALWWVKVTFFDAPSSARPRRPTEVRFTTPAPRHPSHNVHIPHQKLVVGTETLSIVTPLTRQYQQPQSVSDEGVETETQSVPPPSSHDDSVSKPALTRYDTPASPPSAVIVDASPCQILATDWKERKDERRRHRVVNALSARRLVPPKDDDIDDDDDDDGEKDDKCKEKVHEISKMTFSHPTSLPSKVDGALVATNPPTRTSPSTTISPMTPTLTKSPDQLAQNLWGLGIRM